MLGLQEWKHEQNKSDDEESEDESDNEDNESVEDDFYDEMDPDEIQGLANNLPHFNTHENTVINQTMIDATDRSISESDDESSAKDDNDITVNEPEEMHANQPGMTRTRSGRVSKVPTYLCNNLLH
jgi:hypothetical protein